MNEIITEREVLEKLDIPNFRHLSKDKVIAFSSMLPHMEYKVALKALDQYPEFASSLKSAFSDYKEVHKDILLKNHEGVMSYYEMCNSTIVVLNKMIETRKMSFRKTMRVVEEINKITSAVSDKEREDKEFHRDVMKTVGKVALAAMGLLAAAVGVNVFKKK